MIASQIILTANTMMQVYEAHTAGRNEVCAELFICNQNATQWSTLDVALTRRTAVNEDKEFFYRGYSLRPSETKHPKLLLRDGDKVYARATTATISVLVSAEEIVTPGTINTLGNRVDTLAEQMIELQEVIHRSSDEVAGRVEVVTAKYGSTKFVAINITPTISTSIYASGRALGGLLVFEHADLHPGQTGTLWSLRVVDRALQNAALDLVLFNASFAPTVDNVAFAPTALALDDCVGVVSVTSANYWGFSSNAVAVVYPVNMPFVLGRGGRLFGQLVVRATPTYVTTTDIRLRLTLKMDRDGT